MAQEDSTEAEMASEGSEDTVRSSPARRALKIGGGIILGLILLVLLAVAALNTGPGKRFVANQIANLAFANGLKIERSEEHTPELQSLMRISYAVFCLKKKKQTQQNEKQPQQQPKQ